MRSGITDMEMLVENGHMAKFASLITGQNQESPSMFFYPGLETLIYTGGNADSIRERVKKAGGSVDGELLVRLAWSNHDDLDLHLHEPDGTHTYYSRQNTRNGACLDVDRNAGADRLTREPVENIYFSHGNQHRMKEGTYRVVVHNFCRREDRQPGFDIQVECRGQVYDWHFDSNPRGEEYQTIVEFQYSKKDGITLKGKSSKLSSKEKWGVRTNRFVPVSSIMASPNYWPGGPDTGNKHYFFSGPEFKSDEDLRGFLNEHLNPELLANGDRKVMDMLGAKMLAQPDQRPQVSGIGFSTTQPSHLVIRYKKVGQQSTIKLSL